MKNVPASYEKKNYYNYFIINIKKMKCLCVCVSNSLTSLRTHGSEIW